MHFLLSKTYVSKFLWFLGFLTTAMVFNTLSNSMPVAADNAGWLSSGSPTKWAEVRDERDIETNGIDCDYNPSLRVRDLPGYLSTTVEDVTIKACVTPGKYVSLAQSAINGPYDGGATGRYVSFGGEKKMYPLNIPNGDQRARVQLIRDLDILIVESAYNGGWFIYTDFADKLIKTTTPGTNDTSYTLDPASVSYRFTLPVTPSRPNRHVYQRGFGYSENGKYFVFSAVNLGWTHASQSRYYLLDLTTSEMKLFSVAEKDTTDEVHETKRFTVSDNGEYIVGGTVLTFSIWSVDGCGVSMGISHTAITQDPCPSIVIGKPSQANPRYTDYGGDLYGNSQTSLYRFTNNNKSITFAAFSSEYRSKRYSIAAPGYTPSRLNYLALGDSYSSGEGDTYVSPSTHKKRYREHTDVEKNQTIGQPREKCHVSTESYPYKIANSFSWDIATATTVQNRWQTVACSGAQKYDANNTNIDTYEGQGEGKRKQWDSGGGTPRLQGFPNKANLQIEALNEFIPGRQKQIKFVEKYKPKVITLTMGGNDVGFGGIVGECFLQVTTCEKATVSGRKDLGVEIKKQFTKLQSFYDDLKDASPSAKIYVLGYPQIIVDDANVTCPTSLTTINHEERKLFVAGYWYMNEVIRAAARSRGVHYVDTQGALSGHRLCEDGGDPYITSLVAFDNKGMDEAQETFHPNADGHSLIASKFLEKLNYEDPLDYSDYAVDADPNLTEANIPHSAYLQTSTTSTRNVEHKVTTDSEQTRSSPMSIALSRLTFLAGSTVQLTLHSDPVDLGTTTASTDGSASATPIIPSTVPPGYHTLIVSGQTPSGEDIEYEQVILVKGEDPDDIDDDGVPDEQQVCGPFIIPANEDEDYDGMDDACDPEVTAPILYIARNGDVNKGEDSSKLYVYRNTRASDLTDITSDYVDTALDSDNSEALVASSLDSVTSAIYNRFIMLLDGADPNIKIPTILARDSTNACIALQPTDYLSPALNPTDPNYIPRGFTKLTALPIGEDCE